MKSLFFSLAFVLMSTVAFASNNVEKDSKNEESKIPLKMYTCTVTVDCNDGDSATVTSSSTTSQAAACDKAYYKARVIAAK